VRTLAHDLRPGALDDLGLNLALQGFCRDFAERTKSPIHYTGVEVAILSEAMELCLYRFLQEGLNNIAKHATATCVWVNLSTQDKTVTLSLEDNGKGFDTHAVLFATGHIQGIGLLGIDERLQSLGGSLNISSTLGEGTVLVASIPLQEEM
jgi:signal transduction histidine kinase